MFRLPGPMRWLVAALLGKLRVIQTAGAEQCSQRSLQQASSDCCSECADRDLDAFESTTGAVGDGAAGTWTCRPVRLSRMHQQHSSASTVVQLSPGCLWPLHCWQERQEGNGHHSQRQRKSRSTKGNALRSEIRGDAACGVFDSATD